MLASGNHEWQRWQFRRACVQSARWPRCHYFCSAGFTISGRITAARLSLALLLLLLVLVPRLHRQDAPVNTACSLSGEDCLWQSPFCQWHPINNNLSSIPPHKLCMCVCVSVKLGSKMWKTSHLSLSSRLCLLRGSGWGWRGLGGLS